MLADQFASVRCEKYGRIDGYQSLPLWDASGLSVSLRRLENEGNAEMDSLGFRFEKDDAPLYQDFKDARQSRDQWNQQAGNRQQTFDAAKCEYEREHGNKPAVVKPINYTWFRVCSTLLVVGEIPFTSSALCSLGMPFWMQLLLALVIGIVLMTAAHYLGKLLRECPPFDSYRKVLMMGVCTVCPFVAISGLAYLREAYSSAVQASVNQVNAGLSGVPILTTNPALVFCTFLFINLLLYAAVVILAMPLHDLLRVAFTELEHAKQQQANAEHRLDLAHGRRKNHARAYHPLANIIVNKHEALANAYKQANLMVRDITVERQGSADPQRGEPLSFLRQLDIPIPQRYIDPDNHLDWT